MPTFVSARERRLWIWTGLVVLGIYATLGLARTVAGFLIDQNLLAVTFLTAWILVLIAILVQGLRTRPGVAATSVALGVIAVYWMILQRMASPVERSHLFEYSVVGLLVHEALREGARSGRRVPAPAWLAVLVTGVLGLIDELLQLLIPSRVFDPVDILFNLLAAVLAVGGVSAVRAARRWAPVSRGSEP